MADKELAPMGNNYAGKQEIPLIPKGEFLMIVFFDLSTQGNL